MPSTPQQEPRKVYQVIEINRLARAALEDGFGEIWVEGELSEVKKWPSGHTYFSLKDSQAVLRAVFFRNDQRGLSFELKDGEKVQAFGRLTLYEAKGQYQFVVRKAEPAGRGSLQEAFEKLKKKLAEEGLFDPARKRPMPMLPQRLGIVTSPSGAAIHDLLTVLTRRFPNLHIVVAPVKVQGEGAAEEIAEGIRSLNAFGDLDVIIVGRGGGSLEDLWAFNEEIVARAIAASKLPVISAVGHETDFTMSDFVADLRAPTPSAAAELVVGRKDAFEEKLREISFRLARRLQSRALELQNRLIAAGRSYVFREPHNLLRHYRERMAGLGQSLAHAVRDATQQEQQRLDEAHVRMLHRIQFWRAAIRQDLTRLRSQLVALSPQAVLQRGFSITWNAAGAVIRSPSQAEKGETIRTRVAVGTLESSVLTRQPGGQDVREKGGTATDI